MTARLYKGDADRLEGIAKMLDDEADTWAQGFAVKRSDGTVVWDKAYEDAHARFLKLKMAAEFIRKVANRAAVGEEPRLTAPLILEERLRQEVQA